jgi:HD-GYP domain-containing protein (c-di-GMP phosphodiesterase class II)
MMEFRMKFSDLKNIRKDSKDKTNQKNDDGSQKGSQLSFRQLAAEKERTASDVVVSDDMPEERRKTLYEEASVYLSKVVDAVREQRSFELDTGFRIMENMVKARIPQDPLFIKALHSGDASYDFVIHHSVNVAIYAIAMGESLGWSKDRQVEIGMAALLHDVGMAKISEDLIYKQERLDEREFHIFRERPNYGYKILQSFGDEYSYLAECALHVHERIDGSGYPMGLKGDEIHEYAQIIGLVDIYEALVHSRPQREGFLHFTAVKEIIKTGKKSFSRKHLKALLNSFSIFPLFTYVKLNSNAIGKVIETYRDQPMRPKLQIVYDSQKRKVLTERIINLPDNPLLYIVNSVFEEELQETSEGSDGITSASDQDLEGDGILPLEEIGEALGDGHDALPEDAEVENQIWQVLQSKRFKFVLILAGSVFLILVMIWLLGIKGSKPEESGNVKPYIRKEIPKSTSSPKTAAFPGHDLSKDAAEVKVKVEQEVAIPDNEPSNTGQKSGTGLLLQETDAPAGSEESGLTTEELKPAYPYSIKLASVITLKETDEVIKNYVEKGLSPYWVKVDLESKGVWYRIFAGYFEDIQKAEKIIGEYKLKGVIVKNTKYTNLIGTFLSEDELHAKAGQLKDLGCCPYVIKRQSGQYCLYVGAFLTKKGAEDQYSELIARGIQSQIVER